MNFCQTNPFIGRVDSPFRAHAIDLNNVRVIGGWESLVDANNKFSMCPGEDKQILFDTSEAGPGKLSCKVEFNKLYDELPVQQASNGKYKITFSPRICGNFIISTDSNHKLFMLQTGDYNLLVYFDNVLLPRMPIQAIVRDFSSEGATVVLKGHGLAGTRVGEETEIFIDGKDAGDGEPDVTLTGTKSNIKVKLFALGPRLYKATYIPKTAGI